MPRTLGVVPPDHPMFGETHFAFYAGPLVSSEELKAAQAHELDDEVEFVSPRVPGRMQRGASTPPAEKSEGD